MGLIRDLVADGVDFFREEIAPLRTELIKAGLLSPPEKAQVDPKANLVDPIAYNTMQFGYKEKFSLLDYGKMRQISYADPIIAAIIQTRTNQVAAFAKPQPDKYKVGFKVNLRDAERNPSAKERKRAKEIEEFILNCGYEDPMIETPDRKKRDSFEIFLRKVVRDSLTFDQINFEIVPRNNGVPAEFMAVDASTIKWVADRMEQRDYNFGTTPTGDNNAYDYGYLSQVEVRKENVRKAKRPRLVQVLNGQIKATFDEWEMAMGIRNPRTDILSSGYGFSEIEMIVMTITAHMNAETYNRKFFSQGASIKGVITFEGSVPSDQLEAFRRQWHQQVSGVQNSWKTPIMALGKDNKMNWQSLHSTNREMEWGKYMEYLIKCICGTYQIDPLEIGFDIASTSSGSSGGGGLSTLSRGYQYERIIESKDKGLRPLLIFISNLLNEYIVWQIDPEYSVEFVGLNSQSEKDEVELEKQKVETFKMIDELRAENDLKPLPKPEDIKGPGEILLNPQYIQALQTYSQIKGTDQQGMGGGMAGGPGMDGGPGMGAASPQANSTGEPGAGGQPDYESMTTDELEAELAKLEGRDTTKKSMEFLI